MPNNLKKGFSYPVLYVLLFSIALFLGLFFLLVKDNIGRPPTNPENISKLPGNFEPAIVKIKGLIIN